MKRRMTFAKLAVNTVIAISFLEVSISIQSSYANVDTVTVEIPNIVAEPGDSINAVINIKTDLANQSTDIFSATIHLTWDNGVLECLKTSRGSVVPQDWFVITSEITPGVDSLKIGMAGIASLADSGDLAIITFKATGNYGDSTSIHFKEMVFNEGDPITEYKDGSIIFITPTSCTAKDNKMPANYSLLPNYPNPFNTQTTITYYVPVTSRIIIRIYNSLGREVKMLISDKKEMGYHNVSWNGKNNKGEGQPTGVYFIRLEAEDFIVVGKIVLLM